MRKEFVNENGMRKQEKQERDNIQKKCEREYRINYFPFTHGEQVELKRKIKREELKDVRSLINILCDVLII